MNMLKLLILVLEQRSKYLDARFELGRYRDENPTRLDGRLFELDQIINIIKLIDDESKE